MSLVAGAKSFLQWLWQSKARLGLALASALIAAFLIFPYDDLSDFVSAHVSTLSRNTLYVQFERLRMSLFPQPGVQLDQVYIESLAAPGLSIQEVTITPSIRSLLTQKPYGRAHAKGVFNGDVDVSLGSGGTSEKGQELHRLEISAKKLNLQDLRQLTKLPVLLKGRVDLETGGLADLTWAEQPEFDMSLKISQFELPPSNMQTPMGDLTLPELKLSGVTLKGKLSAGRFLIEDAQIGAPGEDIQGTIKGSVNVNLRNLGNGSPTPEFGAYSLEIDMQPSAAFSNRASFFLSLLSGYQEGTRYRFKVSGMNFFGPPNISRMR